MDVLFRDLADSGTSLAGRWPIIAFCWQLWGAIDSAVRDLFVVALQRTRLLYGLRVYGFVVMPEHVHLLLSEPERKRIAHVIP